VKKREDILRSRLLQDTHLPSICAREYNCMNNVLCHNFVLPLPAIRNMTIFAQGASFCRLGLIGTVEKLISLV